MNSMTHGCYHYFCYYLSNGDPILFLSPEASQVLGKEKIRNFCFPFTFLSFFVTALEGGETLEVNLGAGDAFFLEVVES